MVAIKAKTVEQSKASIGNLMQPHHANPTGNVHGGEIIKLMDNVAGIVAFRHARTTVVTARVDELEFHLPIHIADLVTCNGQITFAGTHSMEILVTVLVEDIRKSDTTKVGLTAFFTMVALDQNGKPTAVPPLEVTTDEERKLFEEGQKRYSAHKQKRMERRAGQ